MLGPMPPGKAVADCLPRNEGNPFGGGQSRRTWCAWLLCIGISQQAPPPSPHTPVVGVTSPTSWPAEVGAE